MAELRPWVGAQTYPLHISWMSLWLPDLKNTNLRMEIWKSGRFSERIVNSLSGYHLDLPNSPSEAVKIEAVIRAGSQPSMLRRLGLCWMSPILAAYLVNLRTREYCGTLSKNEIQYILDMRNHTSIDLIGPIKEGSDPTDQGHICLNAWLSALQTDVAKRVQLLLPALDPVPIDLHSTQTAARVALVWSVFNGDS